MLFSLIATTFFMSSICSLEHEIMPLLNTGRIICGYQTSVHNKGVQEVSPEVSIELHGSRLGFVTPGEISLGPLGNTESQEASCG